MSSSRRSPKRNSPFMQTTSMSNSANSSELLSAPKPSPTVSERNATFASERPRNNEMKSDRSSSPSKASSASTAAFSSRGPNDEYTLGVCRLDQIPYIHQMRG